MRRIDKLNLSSFLFTLLALAADNAAAQDGAVNPRTGAPAQWEQPNFGSPRFGMALVDRFESGWGSNKDSYLWDAQAWYGTDWNKLWIKTEGEGGLGNSVDSAQLEVLYGRVLSPFFVWEAGIRHDFKPDAQRNFLVLGVQGLAPYMYELDSAFFLSEDGDTSFRLETEYDIYLTQRLVVQSRLEFNAAFSEVAEVGIGRGINNSEIGFRLRYEIDRKFAPYFGISWSQYYGDTADLQKAGGEKDSNFSFSIGIRAWF